MGHSSSHPFPDTTDPLTSQLNFRIPDTHQVKFWIPPQKGSTTCHGPINFEQ